jgi:predicted DNA-binding protein (MmcQ/YjbR family)
MTGDFAALRAFGLTFPETVEDFPWGHTALKVRGNDQVQCAPHIAAMPGGHGDLIIFVWLDESDGALSLTVKLPVSRDFAETFDFAAPAGYGLGRSGWISCRFGAGEAADLDLLKRWLAESYRAVAPKKLAASVPEQD